MPSKKALLANALSLIGAATLLPRMRATFLKELTILAYHRVVENSYSPTFRFDPELISASTADFEWQMQYVRKNFNPIALRDLISLKEENKPLPQRPIVITFDDGYDDNYYFAFPILKSLEIPATIFLASSLIGQERTFWYDWLYFLEGTCTRSRIPLKFGALCFSHSDDPIKRNSRLIELFSYAKKLPDTQLRAHLAALESMLKVDYPADGFVDSKPLNWDQVREMASCRVDFGSHSSTHPILTNTDDGQLTHELIESKRRIEFELGTRVVSIAYPDGGLRAFDDRVVEGAQAAGYKIGVTYITGINNTRSLDMFRLRRLHVERDMSRSRFSAMLGLPGLLA